MVVSMIMIISIIIHSHFGSKEIADAALAWDTLWITLRSCGRNVAAVSRSPSACAHPTQGDVRSQ